MEQNEQDIQRLLQIREEIHDEIKKIEPSVILLQEMVKRFVAHFDVFEKLSQDTQEQLKSTLKNASFEMAELAADELSKRVETQIQNILENLDESVCEANTVFEKISKKDFLKNGSIIVLLMLLSLSIGFGLGGCYYEKRSNALSREFLRDLSIKGSQQKRQNKV